MTGNLDRNTQSQIDRQLLEQGAFTPLELLLSSGRLAYVEYERWRRGEVEYLDQLLLGNPARIRRQLEAAVSYARRIGLREEQQTFPSWAGDDVAAALSVSADKQLQQLLSLRFSAPQSEPQLDMFFDNPVVALINNIVAALLGRDEAAAAQYLDQLYQQAPNHADLAAFDQLLDALKRSATAVADPALELQALQQLKPHAQRLLSSRSRDFLVPLWRRLAAALTGQAFDRQQPELHNSYVLAQAQDWSGVVEAVLTESQWWTLAPLCLRLAEAAYLQQDRNQALLAWCYMCWYHPEQAEQTLDSREWPDAGVVDLWHRFLDLEDELILAAPLDTDLFPAWLLLAEQGLARVLPEGLPQAASGAGQTYKVAHQLSCARLQQDPQLEMALRKSLLQRQPALFAYLKTRL